MKVVCPDAMRELDRRAIEERGIPGDVLMERAGRAVADEAVRMREETARTGGTVCMAAGPGNNGGDVFAAARVLHECGLPVDVRLTFSPDRLRGDARTHFERMRQSGVQPVVHENEMDWPPDAPDARRMGLGVDGILGTGAQGAPRGTAAAAVRWMRSVARRAPVLAVDIPSGLDADRGTVEGEAVPADRTVTMGLPKRGLLVGQGIRHTGTLTVADIGFPADLTAAAPAEPFDFVDVSDIADAWPMRPRDAHKGAFGRVLVVGGARGYAGAVVMASRAAVRAGAGLVTALTPRSVWPVAAPGAYEVMFLDAEETPQGSLLPEALDDDRLAGTKFDVVLAGPGLTRRDESRRLIERALTESTAPLVLDADGLTVLRGDRGLLRERKAPLVITPHPGEMASLTGLAVEDIQADRVETARRFSEECGCITVLKGAGTVIAAPGRPPAVNMTGNPGLATGGSGDVLAGMLAGLLAQGWAPADAACAAVYLHGRAADRRACAMGQTGLTPTDVIEEIPHAIRDVSIR